MMIPSGIRILEQHKNRPNLFRITLVDAYQEIEQQTYATKDQIKIICELMMEKTEIRLNKKWGRILQIQKISQQTDNLILLRIL